MLEAHLQMPLPVWVLCCTFSHYVTWGIYFGSPSEIQKQAFNNTDFATIRKESATKTITEFSKFSNWGEFFFKQDPKIDSTLEKYVAKDTK